MGRPETATAQAGVGVAHQMAPPNAHAPAGRWSGPDRKASPSRPHGRLSARYRGILGGVGDKGGRGGLTPETHPGPGPCTTPRISHTRSLQEVHLKPATTLDAPWAGGWSIDRVGESAPLRGAEALISQRFVWPFQRRVVTGSVAVLAPFPDTTCQPVFPSGHPLREHPRNGPRGFPTVTRYRIAHHRWCPCFQPRPGCGR